MQIPLRLSLAQLLPHPMPKPLAQLARGVAAAAVLAVAFPLAALGELAPGDPAPNFELQGSDGRVYTLEGLLAKHRGIVLAWFPMAFTGG